MRHATPFFSFTAKTSILSINSSKRSYLIKKPFRRRQHQRCSVTKHQAISQRRCCFRYHHGHPLTSQTEVTSKIVYSVKHSFFWMKYVYFLFTAFSSLQCCTILSSLCKCRFYFERYHFSLSVLVFAYPVSVRCFYSFQKINMFSREIADLWIDVIGYGGKQRRKLFHQFSCRVHGKIGKLVN